MRKVLYILGQLSDQDVDWLSSAGEHVRLTAGVLLIRENTRLDRVFIVLDGELAVSIRGKEIARVGSGDILGEMSLVDRSPTSASVISSGESRLLAIPRDAIQGRIDRDPAFAARFYKAIAIFLASRMRDTLARFGYGEVAREDLAMREDEIDEGVLDNVHLAGGRFERLLKKLSG